MFVMVRQVRLRQKLRYPEIFDELGQDWPTLFAAELTAELSKGNAANV